jgi:hypothetical protein
MFVTRRVTAEIFSTIDKTVYEKARHGFRNGPRISYFEPNLA